MKVLKENITPADITGMGPISLPTPTKDGSGDIPAGSGDAKQEYKKKKRIMAKLKTFKAFTESTSVEESIITEAKFTFSEKEVKDVADRLAKAMAKVDNVHVGVHDFEYDKGKGAGWELSFGGEDYDGGSYFIRANGDVVNAAIGGGTVYGNIKSTEKDFIKWFKANESVSLFEGGMSDIYIIAQDAKDETSFLKDFFKEFGDKVKKTADSIDWAKSIYADAKAMTLESILTEARGDQFLIIKDGKDVKGFKSWKGAKKFVSGDNEFSTDDIQSAEWYHDNKSESVIAEAKTAQDYQEVIDSAESKIWELQNSKKSWIPEDKSKRDKMIGSFQKKVDAAQKKLDNLSEAVVNEKEVSMPRGLESFANDLESENRDPQIHLATFDGTSFQAQSTNKTWDDGVPVTKNFTRGGYKSVGPKGEHHIIEVDTFWYFVIGRTWYAVKRKDYGTPPFEY